MNYSQKDFVYLLLPLENHTLPVRGISGVARAAGEPDRYCPIQRIVQGRNGLFPNVD